MSFRACVTRRVTEEELIREETERFRVGRSARSALALVVLAVSAVALMVFSRWTFSLGLLILTTIGLLLYMPSSIGRDPRRRRRWAHLAGDQEHGVDENGIWLRTAHVELWSTWMNLASWERDHGVLRLQCGGMPEVVIPEDALAGAGGLESATKLARAWGKQRRSRRAS